MNVKISWSLSALHQLLPDIVRGGQKSIPDPLLKAVKGEISIGKSPVEGVGRYQGYSPGYQNEIKVSLSKAYGKARRPVNLYLSGKMIASGYVREIKGGVVVGFTDRKAVFHDRDGAGKSKVLRRMLPTRQGETFSRTIMQKIMRVLSTEVLAQAIAKARRR